MSDIIRYFERFSVDDPGKWFRILPVGSFQRFGRDVSIGPSEIEDMAANFKAAVPETGIPVTLEHMAEAGKVGDVAALDVREDGLYARIDWKERGLELLKQGAFQFFSPEIVWGEMDHEGRTVRNIMMGLSLVNAPFFGKQTAVFSLVDSERYREFTPEQRRALAEDGKAMPDGSFPIVTEQDLQNALSAWGRAENQADVQRHIMKRAKELDRTDLLPADWEGSKKETEDMNVIDELKGVLEEYGIKPKAASAPTPVTETAEYKALAADKLAVEAKLTEQEKAQRVTANVEKFGALLKLDKFEASKGLAEKFAAVAEVDAKLADELVTEFRALVEQAAKGALFGEIGTNQPGEASSDAEKFLALADAKAKELKIDMAAALKVIAAENPALYATYRKSSYSAVKAE